MLGRRSDKLHRRLAAASNEVDGKCDLNLETHKQCGNKTSSAEMESIPILSAMLLFVWGNYRRLSELISHMLLLSSSCSIFKMCRIRSENVTIYHFSKNLSYYTLKLLYFQLLFCAFIHFLRVHLVKNSTSLAF